jgi:hypothetical protein
VQSASAKLLTGFAYPPVTCRGLSTASLMQGRALMIPLYRHSGLNLWHRGYRRQSPRPPGSCSRHSPSAVRHPTSRCHIPYEGRGTCKTQGKCSLRNNPLPWEQNGSRRTRSKKNSRAFRLNMAVSCASRVGAVQQAHCLQLRDSDLLCTASKTKSISSTDMTTAIRQAAVDAAENPDNYGTHSLRSGGATALFAAGVDRLAIKHLGRWRSDCYEQYARTDNVTLKGIAAAMATVPRQPSSKSSVASPQWGHSTPHPRLELHNCK